MVISNSLIEWISTQEKDEVVTMVLACQQVSIKSLV